MKPFSIDGFQCKHIHLCMRLIEFHFFSVAIEAEKCQSHFFVLHTIIKISKQNIEKLFHDCKPALLSRKINELPGNIEVCCCLFCRSTRETKIINRISYLKARITIVHGVRQIVVCTISSLRNNEHPGFKSTTGFKLLMSFPRQLIVQLQMTI